MSVQTSSNDLTSLKKKLHNLRLKKKQASQEHHANNTIAYATPSGSISPTNERVSFLESSSPHIDGSLAHHDHYTLTKDADEEAQYNNFQSHIQNHLFLSRTHTQSSPPSSSNIFERSVQSPNPNPPPANRRSQSFSSNCSLHSIPAHLSQEIYVPSVLDATAEMLVDFSTESNDQVQNNNTSSDANKNDDVIEVICGQWGHPLAKRHTHTGCLSPRANSIINYNHQLASQPLLHKKSSFNGASTPITTTETMTEVGNEKEEDEDENQFIDFSDTKKLNFCSFSDLMSDEEMDEFPTNPTSPSTTRKNSILIVPLSLRNSLNQ